MTAHKTLDLTGYRLNAKSVRLAVLDGNAQCEALTMGMPSPVYAFLSYSIQEIDGEPMSPPCLEWQRWNAKTRAFVTRAWSRLHDVPQSIISEWLERYRDSSWPPGGSMTFDLAGVEPELQKYLAKSGMDVEPLSIRSFTLRERTTADEIASSGGLPVYFGRLQNCLTHVDGAPVPTRADVGPDADRYTYQPWRGWTWWTVAFVSAAYELMNEPEVDIQDFLARTFPRPEAIAVLSAHGT